MMLIVDLLGTGEIFDPFRPSSPSGETVSIDESERVAFVDVSDEYLPDYSSGIMPDIRTYWLSRYNRDYGSVSLA